MKIMLIPLAILSSGLYFYFVSSFAINFFNIAILSLLLIACVYHAFAKRIEIVALMALGLPIIIGLVNEWSASISELLHGYNVLSLVIACLAGYAFFKMFLHQAEELIEHFSWHLFITLAINLAFWLCLVTQFNSVPWYVHATLGVLALLASVVYGYFQASKNNDSNKSTILSIASQIFSFMAMSAHFIAEGCIAAAQSIKKLRVFFASTAIVTEGVLDMPAMISEDEHEHGDQGHSRFSVIDFGLSFMYAGCLAALGYLEIPKLFKVFNIRVSSALQNFIVFSIIAIGASACWMLNYNNINSGEHSHSVSSLSDIFSLRSLIAVFGAILTSTVGVAISYEIFKLPIWLFVLMTFLAFFVEWNFIVTNLPKSIAFFPDTVSNGCKDSHHDEHNLNKELQQSLK